VADSGDPVRAAGMSDTVIRITGLRHAYPGRQPIAFPDVALAPGEAVALLGPSGSGKTTLLLLAAGLLTAQQGELEVAGAAPARLPGAARDRWRGRTIGVVLQSFGLLPWLTVRENLLAAQFCAGLKPDAAGAEATLQTLGIAALAGEKPSRLSRGQQQRAAIARAVVNGPRLILADEPTSSLDDGAAEAALGLLREAQARLGAALLIATHDRRVRPHAGRSVELAAA
jgi:putative ABC transport system ATP-binding protein